MIKFDNHADCHQQCLTFHSDEILFQKFINFIDSFHSHQKVTKLISLALTDHSIDDLWWNQNNGHFFVPFFRLLK